MKPALCLRHEEPDHLGTAAEVFDEMGIGYRYLDLWTGVTPPDPGDAAGVVVLGGVMNVDQVDDFPFLREERTWMRRAVEQGVPLLGICLGGQLLARALDAAVTRAPARELGFYPLRPTPDATDDPLFSSIEEGDRLFQWHEDSFRTPAGGRLLLTGEDGSHQAFRVGERAWGTQFHPEVTPGLLEAWLAATPPEVLSDRWGRSADELAAEARAHLPAQQERARGLFRRFATLVTEATPARR